jgi:hypothetical protein
MRNRTRLILFGAVAVVVCWFGYAIHKQTIRDQAERDWFNMVMMEADRVCRDQQRRAYMWRIGDGND